MLVFFTCIFTLIPYLFFDSVQSEGVLLSEETTNRFNDVFPQFNCWFRDLPYVNGSDTLHLVFGYANEYNSDVFISVGQNNKITPSYLDTGNQPFIFKQGHNPFMMTLQVPSNVDVSWLIGNNEVTVTNVQLGINHLCLTRYQRQCPLWIDNFCQDESYCNGREICESSTIKSLQTTTDGGGNTLQGNANIPHGICRSSTTPIVCDTNEVCNEDSRSCVAIETTTVEPTSTTTESTTTTTTTTTPQVTEDINDITTSIKPSNKPTNAPTRFVLHRPSETPHTTTHQPSKQHETTTLEPVPVVTTPVSNPSVSVECTSNTDCQNLFCKGESTCNLTSHQCISNDKSFDPCIPDKSKSLNAFLQKIGWDTSKPSPIKLTCNENFRTCIESYTCSSDSDCNDNLTCNGEEYCLDGQCFTAKNQSLDSICGFDNASCTEELGCHVYDETYNYSHSPHHHHHPPTVPPPNEGAAIAIGVIAAILVLLLFIIIIAIFVTQRRYYTPPPRGVGGGGGGGVGLGSNIRRPYNQTMITRKTPDSFFNDEVYKDK